jgi:membrane-bound metal-dependent hydrolase YbcI (DUF457 family)
MRAFFPTRSLILLLTIGLIDLITTAVLHAKGLIVEMNPLMRVLIDRSEWLFALAKLLTLVVAWVVLARYAKNNIAFVRAVCKYGSLAYIAVWTIWFIAGRV